MRARAFLLVASATASTFRSFAGVPRQRAADAELTLEQLVAMEDKEIDVEKTMNFDSAKKNTTEEIERERKKMRLKAQLQNKAGRSSAMPMCLLATTSLSCSASSLGYRTMSMPQR